MCGISSKDHRPAEQANVGKTAEQWKALADGIEKYEAKFGIGCCR
jgi:hypothetical protein